MLRSRARRPAAIRTPRLRCGRREPNSCSHGSARRCTASPGEMFLYIAVGLVHKSPLALLGEVWALWEDQPVSTHPTLSVGGRLRADLESAGVSARGPARGLAGPDATKEKVENVRSQVQRWLAITDGRGKNQGAPHRSRRPRHISDSYIAPRFGRRQKLERRLEHLRAEEKALREELAHLPEP
jgi:hypothetical protein